MLSRRKVFYEGRSKSKLTSRSIWNELLRECFSFRVEIGCAKCLSVVLPVRNVSIERRQSDWKGKRFRIACATLTRLREGNRRKRPRMLSDGVIHLHDNASPILLAKLKNCCKSSRGKTGLSLHTAQIWCPAIFSSS